MLRLQAADTQPYWHAIWLPVSHLENTSNTSLGVGDRRRWAGSPRVAGSSESCGEASGASRGISRAEQRQIRSVSI